MAAACPQFLAGEYYCDFKNVGCDFIAQSAYDERRHYESVEVRHKHVRLLSNKLRHLEERIKELEHNNQQIQQHQAEILQLKQIVAHLKAQNRRVCSIWELSAGDLQLPLAAARWEHFQTDQFGYAFAVRISILQAPGMQELQYVISLKLRGTPHDRALQWPFSRRLEIDIVPPEGYEHLQPRTCVVETGNLTILERPPAPDRDAEPLDIQHPACFTLEQLLAVPVDGKFVVSFATQPVPIG